MICWMDSARRLPAIGGAKANSGHTEAPAGQLGLMRSAAVELARHKITVNAVLPGNVYTEGLAAYGQSFLETVKAIIPLHTIGTVRDIGYACLYLASREAAFVTGQTLVLDGGQTVPETPEFAAAW